MNRRAFLQRAGGAVAGVVAAGALASPAAYPDRFDYRGWRVRWFGWGQPANQAVALGYWIAYRDDQPTMRYSTTMGGVSDHNARDLDMLDMTWNREWPSPKLMAMEPERREAVKRRALDALLAVL